MDNHGEAAADLAYSLQHIASTMSRQTDQVLQERLGIGIAQLRILMMLDRLGLDARQRRVANLLGQTEASISRQIKLLEEKNFLTVRINPQSRREHLLVPTAKGLKLTEAALQIVNEHSVPLAGLLSDKQQEQMSGMLATLHAQICAPGKLYACDHFTRSNANTE